MDSDNELPAFSVRVPRGFKPRFASIYRPMRGLNGMTDKYGCCFPADELPAGVEALGSYTTGRGFKSIVRELEGQSYIYAKSNLPPPVIPGTGSRVCFEWWQHQLGLCDAMNLPRDFLFRDIELVLLVQPFKWQSPAQSPVRAAGTALVLKAVTVVDPSDDRGLNNLLGETRAAIREGQKYA